MILLKDSARDCYMELCRMVSAKEGALVGHPIHRYMRQLQKRYSGVFPGDLDRLWNAVRLPTHSHAALQYHDGVRRLRDFLGKQFGFLNEENKNDKSDGSDAVSADDWFDGDNRRDSVETGLGCRKELDGDDAPGLGRPGLDKKGS